MVQVTEELEKIFMRQNLQDVLMKQSREEGKRELCSQFDGSVMGGCQMLKVNTVEERGLVQL
jgi:hypothetical protein